MDLSQTLLPLIIDPRTSPVTVRASIKVPDDIFPTITSVPGGILAFRYFVEVVLDLKGKLVGQDTFLSHFGVMTSAAKYNSLGTSSVDVPGTGNSLPSTWVGSIVDTERLCREKIVIGRTFEVIVGTKDSTQTSSRPVKAGTEYGNRSQSGPNEAIGGMETNGLREHSPTREDERDGNVDGTHRQIEAEHEEPFSVGERLPRAILSPPYINHEVDEKTRIKQAEQRLLPSSPPGDAESSGSQAHLATLCPLTALEAGRIHENGDVSRDVHTPLPSAPPADELMRSEISPAGPFNQPQTPLALAIDSVRATATEDKQETERRYLQGQISAPDVPVHPRDEAVSTVVPTAPSASILTESDAHPHTYLNGIGGLAGDDLPRYER